MNIKQFKASKCTVYSLCFVIKNRGHNIYTYSNLIIGPKQKLKRQKQKTATCVLF